MSGSMIPAFAAGLQAVGGLAKGIGARNAANGQAAIADENARLSLLSGEQDVAAIMRKARMDEGAVLAAGAGSGGGVSGSIADIITESAMNAERDIAMRRTQARRQEVNYRQEAADARAAGKSALIDGVFGAVSGALKNAAALRAQRLTSLQSAKELSNRLGGSRLTGN